jgi:hypothetical protein
LLYGRRDAVVARIGTTPWNWSAEIPIISRPPSGRASYLYEKEWSDTEKKEEHPYGPSLLKRFTEWDPTRGILDIFFLISLFKGYQLHVMQTRLRIVPGGVITLDKAHADDLVSH